VTVEVTWRCPRPPGRLLVRDDSFDLLGPHHRTLVRIEGAAVGPAALLPESRAVTLDLGPGAAQGTSGFFLLGVEHILTGFDHLLFLAGLLLGGGGPLTLLKIVTAFTIAHSLTLGTAVTGLVSVSARVVEPAIAASIVYVALENVLRGGALSRRWLVSFVFGLVHGLGFASALEPLRLPEWDLGLALFGFNVGVETGQALVIAVVVPAVLWAKGRPWQPSVARALSLVVAFVGTVWFLQRLLVT
jgi:hydrogenase/urease accessory protein HupE